MHEFFLDLKLSLLPVSGLSAMFSIFSFWNASSTPTLPRTLLFIPQLLAQTLLSLIWLFLQSTHHKRIKNTYWTTCLMCASPKQSFTREFPEVIEIFVFVLSNMVARSYCMEQCRSRVLTSWERCLSICSLLYPYHVTCYFYISTLIRYLINSCPTEKTSSLH